MTITESLKQFTWFDIVVLCFLAIPICGFFDITYMIYPVALAFFALLCHWIIEDGFFAAIFYIFVISCMIFI